jgi:hypothetical protein
MPPGIVVSSDKSKKSIHLADDRYYTKPKRFDVALGNGH